MNVVNLCFYAEGYYSGQTYEENILISENLYEKIKDKVEEMEVCVCELDGKHSQVWGDIEAELCEEKDIPKWYKNLTDDGETFWIDLEELCQEEGLDLSADVEEVKEYVKSLDYCVDITVSVKKSNVEKLKKFAESLS